MVELEVNESVAWLTLQRPKALNSLDTGTIQYLADHIRTIRRRRDIRVVVTCGAGRSFCAGSDLRELGAMGAAEAGAHEGRCAKVISQLDSLPQPTIAMIHGHALGGGLGLALYHDFRIAADDAILGLPEVELGWTPPWAVGRAVEIAGPSRARWLLLTAGRISGSEAARIGLVDEAVNGRNLEERVRHLAERLAGMPAEGLAQTKKLLQRMSPLRAPSWDADAASAFQICYAKPEARARVKEFLTRSKKRSK